MCVRVSDLWSRVEQLLVFKSQSLFLQLQLLQSHLVVPCHDGRVLGAGGELGALLYWSTLGNSLLVQSYTQEDRKKKRRDLKLFDVYFTCNNPTPKQVLLIL